MSFFKDQKVEGKNQAVLASNLFWQLCERKYQDLVINCKDINQTKALRKDFALFASKAYNSYCPKDTARQLDAWAKNMPNLSKYLKETQQPKAEA